MPLEINEIDIAMRVTDGDGRRDSFGESAAGQSAGIDREELIEECVRRVLQELKNQSEP